MMPPTDSLFFDSAFCSRLGLMLLHSLWQVALLAMVAWGVERLWPQRSVERSYRIYVAALLVALGAMPLTFGWLEGGGKPLVLQTAEVVAPVESPASKVFVAPSVPLESQANVQAAVPSTPKLPVALLPVVAPTVWQRAAPWLVVGYGLGVVLMLVRLVRAWASSHRLGRRAKTLNDGPLVETLRSLARRWSLRVVPMLAETREVVVPKVVGLARPMILLPTAAIAGLSPSELEMILAHELAHIRRHDMWVNLLQRLAEVVLFFNPALWLVSRRISTLREYCCDEMTCEAMASAKSENDLEPKLRYATALLRVAELAQSKTVAHSDLAALAASGRSPSELRRRVARLFGEPMREPMRVSRGGILMMGVALLLMACGPMIWPSRAGIKEVSEHSNVINQFSFGGRVEILALGTHKEKTQRWWDANGERRQSVPFHLQGGTVSISDDYLRRELVFRVQDLPKDATVIWKLSTPGSTANGEVVLNGQDSPAGYYSEIFSVPSDINTLDLRVGVASGGWRTVTDWAPSGNVAQGFPDGNSLVIAETFVGKHGTSIVVSHSFRKSNCRIRAIDIEGEFHKSIRNSEKYAGSGSMANLSTWHFGDLPLGKIKRFEFQVREYEWVEIKRLPVNPKAPATISGKIVLEDGSPSKVNGWLHYISRKDWGSSSGTVDEYVDQFNSEVPSGKVWLWYFADGFSPAIVGPYDLASGENKEVTITLKAGYSVPLRVVGAEEGNPVPDAILSASPVVEGHSAGSPYSESMAFDDRGKFLLENVADVEYSMMVKAPGFERLCVDSRKMVPNKVLTLSMIRSQPASGIVSNADGSPAAFAKLFLKQTVTVVNAHYSRSFSGGLLYGDLATITDAQGRFVLDQLAQNSYYVFVVETTGEARLIVYDIKAGQQDIKITVPERRDLHVKVAGAINGQEQFHGSPTVYVRQRIKFNTQSDFRHSHLLGKNLPIEITTVGGTSIYHGLPVNPTANEGQQQVEISINANVEGKIIDINPEGVTNVEFVLPGAVDQENVSPRLQVREVRLLTTAEEIKAARANPNIKMAKWSPRPGRSETLAWPTDGPVVFTEKDVISAAVKPPPKGGSRFFQIELSLLPAAGDRLRFTTKRLVKSMDELPSQLLAIFFEGKVLMAPKVRGVIGEKIAISGSFTEEEAKSLTDKIVAGRLGEMSSKNTMTIRVLDINGKPIENAKVFQNHVLETPNGKRPTTIKNHNYLTDPNGDVNPQRQKVRRQPKP